MDFCGQWFHKETEIEDHWTEAFKTFARYDFAGYICEICYEKEMQQEDITDHREATDVVDKADKYDVHELNEHLETVYDVKKTKYYLLKH